MVSLVSVARTARSNIARAGRVLSTSLRIVPLGISGNKGERKWGWISNRQPVSAELKK